MATLVAAGLIGSTLVAMTATPAGAAVTTTIADWHMDEPAGSTVMVDSSGNGINGSIGSAVITGATFDGATGYRWPFASPTLPPAKPERLVEVDDSRLNPESGDYAVTVRYRTIQNFGNILQKGQGGATGGYYKLENPGGIFTCVFRGVDAGGDFRRKEVNSGVSLSDGQWHTARCERTANALTLTIDGTITRTTSGLTGNISNTRPISIAGKSNCDQINTTCDYFTGDIDYVKIEGPDIPPPPVLETVFSHDFSSGDFSQWSTVTRLSIDPGAGNAAPPSARANTVNQSAWAAVDLANPFNVGCVSFAVEVTSAAGSIDLMRLRTAGNGNLAKVVLTDQGILRFRSDVSGVVRNTGVGLPSGWNTLKLCGAVGTSGRWDMFLNGIKILDAWTANTGTAPAARVQIGGTAARTLSIGFDDIVVEAEVT